MKTVDDAKKLALDHHMFVVQKGPRYLVFRRMSDRSIFLGTRSNPEGLYSFVSKCATARDSVKL